jgi:Ca-activated chloride channel homolog
MNTIRIIIFLTILFFLNKNITAQTAHKLLRKGDSQYAENNYKEAEELYKKADATEGGGKVKYNLGNSIFNQQKYDEAIKQYDKAVESLKDNRLKANSLYNKGNAHFWKKEYDKAVNSYKEALRLNPQDEDTKKNLSLAKKMLQEQQKQQEKDKQDKQNENKDKKDNKDQKQDDKQNQNQEQDKQQQQKEQQNQDKNQNSQQNPQDQAQQNLKKDEAKRMLQIMDDEERKVQQRLRKGKPKPSRSSKDW